MNADLSIAPEIAQLAAPYVPPPPGRPARRTTGVLAAELARLAAAPQRWWDLVRFNPDRPARIPVPAPFEAWLLVIPPGQAAACRCEFATLVAGEAAEGPLRLRQARVLVHGLRAGHPVRGTGHGYAVTLHADSELSRATGRPRGRRPLPGSAPRGWTAPPLRS